MRPAPVKSVMIGTAFLLGILLLAVIGVAASPQDPLDALSVDPPSLTNPFVSEPVEPADTKGLPPAALGNTQPNEPQEMAYPRPLGRAQPGAGIPAAATRRCSGLLGRPTCRNQI